MPPNPSLFCIDPLLKAFSERPHPRRTLKEMMKIAAGGN
jgi:hypothetical protein